MQTASIVQSEPPVQIAARRISVVQRLVDRSFWLYPFIAPPLLFPTFAPLWTGLAALAIPLLFVLRRRAAGHFIPRTPLDWPILGLLFVVPIGAWASADIGLSLPRVTVLLLSTGLFYATVDAVRSRPDRVHLLTWGLALIGGGVALIGLVGTDWFAYKLPALSLIYDSLPSLIRDIPNSIRGGIHPNELAGTLVFLLPIAIAVLVADLPMTVGRWTLSAWWTRLLAGAIVALMGGVLILSQSRWGLAVLAVTMLVWLAARSRRPWRLLLIGALLIGAATVVIGPERLVDAIFSANLESSWRSRAEIWRNALNTIQDFPFTGIGLGTFAHVSPLLYPYVLWPPGVNFGHAHNVFLQIGVDLGVVGLVSALAAAIILAGVAREGYRPSSGVRRVVLVGLSIGLLAYALFGLTDAVALGAKPSPLVWMTAGLIVAVAQTHHEVQIRLGWSRRRAGLVLALVLMSVIVLGPTLFSRFASNVGLVTLNRSLAQHGALWEGGRDDPDLVQAERWLRLATELDAANQGAWRGLGFVLAAQGRMAAAVSAWRTVGGMDGDFIQRGDSNVASNRYEDAAEWYIRATQIQPDNGKAWYWAGVAYRATHHHEEARAMWENALHAYERVRDATPHNRDAWYGLGKTYAALEEWSNALSAFEHGATLDAGQTGKSLFFYQIGLIHQYSEMPANLSTAWEAYEQAVTAKDYSPEHWSESDTHHQRGTILVAWEEWDEAIQEFQAALKIYPGHYWASVMLGFTLWRAGLVEEATNTLNRAILLDPGKKNAYQVLGDVYSSEGEVSLARELYEKVLELDSNDGHARQALDALELLAPDE